MAIYIFIKKYYIFFFRWSIVIRAQSSAWLNEVSINHRLWSRIVPTLPRSSGADVRWCWCASVGRVCRRGTSVWSAARWTSPWSACPASLCAATSACHGTEGRDRHAQSARRSANHPSLFLSLCKSQDNHKCRSHSTFKSIRVELFKKKIILVIICLKVKRCFTLKWNCHIEIAHIENVNTVAAVTYVLRSVETTPTGSFYCKHTRRPPRFTDSTAGYASWLSRSMEQWVNYVNLHVTDMYGSLAIK